MNNNHDQSNVSQAVLERIRSGKLRMRPHFYFFAQTALVIGVATLILIVSIWLASFISFGLRFSGNESLLGFGGRGPYIFFMLFPWGLALLDGALVILLSSIVRRFKFGYRQPFFYIVLVGVVASVLAGVLLDRETSFHDERFEEAEAGELLAPFDAVYESAHMRAPEEYGLYRGFVVEIGEESFLLTHDDYDNDEDDGTWSVIPPDDFEIEVLKIGDRVYVAGEREHDEIEAYGVRILTP